MKFPCFFHGKKLILGYPKAALRGFLGNKEAIGSKLKLRRDSVYDTGPEAAGVLGFFWEVFFGPVGCCWKLVPFFGNQTSSGNPCLETSEFLSLSRCFDFQSPKLLFSNSKKPLYFLVLQKNQEPGLSRC